MEKHMDRRQRKSREAIFRAFTQLLCECKPEQITVSKIIERADVGRATFYAHFETRDSLIQALCQDLFCHVFDSIGTNEHTHKHLFECDAPKSVFEHLFRHLKNNDHQILQLLTHQGDGQFADAFRKELIGLLRKRPQLLSDAVARQLPEDYWVEHIATAFIGTVRWWYSNQMACSPEDITKYFLLANHIQE